MQGVEESHLNAAIMAVLKAYYDFCSSTIEEALRPLSKYGKKDTLGMDAGPEITICEELSRYDSGAIIITEEIGSEKHSSSFEEISRFGDPQTFRTVYICDPTDRSNQLKSFLGEFGGKMKIKEILTDKNSLAKWEKEFSGPAVITGSTSAITCIRRGIPIFTVIVNYITRDLMISCDSGNRIYKLPTERPSGISLQVIQEKGKLITFPMIGRNTEQMRRFTTFLGDVGKVGYMENFRDSGFMADEQMNNFLHYGKPGGPSRIIYLSALQPVDKRIGFVLSNGEKITEWIHWLPFVRFARGNHDESQSALMIYEVFQDRPWTKEGVLMSTPPNYSVFRVFGGKMHIDISWLLKMPNPSQLRSTLFISPYDNRWAKRFTGQSGYREIKF